jgi:hypothetical protein
MEWDRAYVVARRVSWSSCSVVTSGGHEVNTLILLDLDSWLDVLISVFLENRR